MKKYLLLPMTLIACLLHQTASAVLMTDTWQLTTTSTSNLSGIAVDDVFNILITYDNAGVEMTQYSDGPNGVAEFGAGDDLFYESRCINVDPSCTYDNYGASGYTFFSNAMFDLTSISAVVPTGSVSAFDAEGLNLARRYQGPNGNFAEYMADSRLIILSESGLTHLNFYGIDGHGNGLQGVLEATSVITDSTPAVTVPSPSVVSLMGLGLVGFGFAQRRRSKRSISIAWQNPVNQG